MTTESLAAIYVLVDPRTWRICYVGKSVDPAKRYRAHCAKHLTRRHAVDEWVESLRACGMRPKMRILKWTAGWETEERKLISRCRKSGRSILNVEDGGLVAKKSQKRLSAAFKTYRALVAVLARQVNDYKRRGLPQKADALHAKMLILKERVRQIERSGPQAIEDFYNRIEQRFGNVRA